MSFDAQWVLQVRAPKFMLSGQIQSFIDKNNAWIEKHFQKITERLQNKKYYLFGKALTQFSPNGRDETTKYYKQEAKNYIVPRCNELAQKYGFTHTWIRITSATTRWGSCSSRKTLNFSYRLIMSPPECIDYVIIHELCHLRQMNHWAKFWKEVSDIMPDYKLYENHLKSEGWKYTL